MSPVLNYITRYYIIILYLIMGGVPSLFCIGELQLLVQIKVSFDICATDVYQPKV